MVVHDLYFESVCTLPAEHHPPLVIDSNGVESFPFASELFPGDSPAVFAGPLALQHHVDRAAYGALSDEALVETFGLPLYACHQTDPRREHFRRSQSRYYIISIR